MSIGIGGEGGRADAAGLPAPRPYMPPTGRDGEGGLPGGWRMTAFGPRRPGVVRVALTGGPAGGKTSLVSRILSDVPSLGWSVLVVNETSTEMRGNGVGALRGIDGLAYQRLVTCETVWKECLYERAAAMADGPVLIVTDRGVMDGKAFLRDDAAFASILAECGVDEGQVVSSYDAVIHLVTAADGAGEHYGANNPMRTEALDGAVAVDRDCLRVWSAHPRRVVVSNGVGGFERKMRVAMRAVHEAIAAPGQGVRDA